MTEQHSALTPREEKKTTLNPSGNLHSPTKMMAEIVSITNWASAMEGGYVGFSLVRVRGANYEGGNFL